MKRILLIVTGGIAAYKSLELVRLLKERGDEVRCILTEGGSQFVTSLSLATLSSNKVLSALWSLDDEAEIGHIQLSREADLIVVAPASADMLAKMAGGIANDLASTVLLATDKKVLAAPAMNVRMWEHEATRANCALLQHRGIHFIGPNEGEMACGEHGYGRMAEPAEIVAAIDRILDADRPLAGYSALVTSGPTHEPIDPVRYIANRSSGKQGHAIAAALAGAGASVTLVSGPTALPAPHGVRLVPVETAAEMLAACEGALPVDIAVAAAAVADWRVEPGLEKIKKGNTAPSLSLIENPDILSHLGHHKKRPKLVIGFAAETENLIENATAKRLRKKCDWMIANLVGDGMVFGSDTNAVTLIRAEGNESLPLQSKHAIADYLVTSIVQYLIVQYLKHN
jgi:phosphopantothenoylcysteine decarboxylase/phosphopantothenate--cysteine ligase